MALKFHCPRCDYEGTEIEEVCSGAVISSLVETNKDGEQWYTNDMPEIHEAYTDRYQCKVCGFILKKKGTPIDSSDQVAVWLEENCDQEVNQ